MNKIQTIDFILENSKNIAVVGLSPDKSKASFLVAKFLQEKSYKIYPIYPKFDEILGKKVYRSLDEIEDKIDLVLMFRKGEVANELFPIILEKKIPSFWLQLGIFNEKIAKKCENFRINFIQNRCIMIEYEKRKNNART